MNIHLNVIFLFTWVLLSMGITIRNICIKHNIYQSNRRNAANAHERLVKVNRVLINIGNLVKFRFEMFAIQIDVRTIDIKE